MSLKVFSTQCKNCLLSPDRIVSAKIAKEIIQNCAKNQTHFVCHKASMKKQDVCCKGFFDNFGHLAKNIQLAKWLDVIEWVPQEDSKKLPTYKSTE